MYRRQRGTGKEIISILSRTKKYYFHNRKNSVFFNVSLICKRKANKIENAEILKAFLFWICCVNSSTFPSSYSRYSLGIVVVVVSLTESQHFDRESVKDGYVYIAMLCGHRRRNGKVGEIAATSAMRTIRQMFEKFREVDIAR